jgi:hypothetical protein
MQGSRCICKMLALSTGQRLHPHRAKCLPAIDLEQVRGSRVGVRGYWRVIVFSCRIYNALDAEDESGAQKRSSTEHGPSVV